MTEWTQEIAKHVGDRIRSMRSERGISRDDLALLLGVGYNSVAGWENGLRPPKLDSLLLLTEALRLHSIEELLGGPFGTQILLERRNK